MASKIDKPEIKVPEPDLAGEGLEDSEAPNLPDMDAEEEAQDELPVGGEGMEAGRETAITGRYNQSPVGDIKMTKKKGTYNTYSLELSMGQLEVILSALEQNHTDPVSDELLATFHYYIDKLPGPGEEEEEKPKKGEAGALAGEEGEMGLPLPPGSEAGTPPEGSEEAPTEPPEPAGLRRLKGEKPGLPDIEAEEHQSAKVPEPPRE